MLLQYFNKGFLRTALLVLYIRPMFSLKLHLNHFYANSFLPPLPSPFPPPFPPTPPPPPVLGSSFALISVNLSAYCIYKYMI